MAPALREEGFRGDAADYDDLRNLFLDQVLERRRGLPIALATLTLAVARRAGVSSAGIGMPGHFVVAELARGEPEYLDPFDRWERRSVADLAAIVRAPAGFEMRPEFLAPADDRAPRADAREPARLLPAPPPAARRALDRRAGSAPGAGRRGP